MGVEVEQQVTSNRAILLLDAPGDFTFAFDGFVIVKPVLSIERYIRIFFVLANYEIRQIKVYI